MKNILYLIFLLLPLTVFSQSRNQNYVKTKVYKSPSTGNINSSDTIVNVKYYDGLGREMQSVSVKAGGTGKDIITPIIYDEDGRLTKKYMPLADVNSAVSPNYRDNNMTITNLNSYYQNKYSDDFTTVINPYKEIEIEASPLGRVLKEASAGSDWALANNHTIRYEYDSNSYTFFGSTRVYSFSVNFESNNTQQPILKVNAAYAAGQLYRNVLKNENWTSGDGVNNTSEEFINKQGQLILKRAYTNNIHHDTYYVYDKFGNLTFVIPPKASSTIVIETVTLEGITYNVNSDVLDGLCYKYSYDHRNRVIEKQTPDKGIEYIVYDKLDRPVLTQDANQRSQTTKKWSFVKYDKWDRVVYNGEYTSAASRESLQNTLNNATVISEEKTTNATLMMTQPGLNSYYTKAAFPTTNITVHTVNYYDDHEFDKAGITVPASTPHHAISTANKEMSTGSKVRVLNTNSWITTVIAYDIKGRVVWAKNNNSYFNNTKNTVTAKLNFTGQVLETETIHEKGADILKVRDVYTYDFAGRPLLHLQNLNDSGTRQLISSKKYDELGALVQEKVGETFPTFVLIPVHNSLNSWQTVDYDYNVRGWLKSINNPDQVLTNDLFAYKINYNTTDNAQSTALFNGNIAETVWRSQTDNNKRQYSYNYDHLNRLTEANYIAPNVPQLSLENFTENVAYDMNGNITALERYGLQNGTSYGLIDNLSYSYNTASNKLKAVHDTAGNDGFNNGATTSTEYTYDANGNMITDANKGITAITYNHLNLPTRVTFNATKYIDYVYDGLGTKLKKTVVNGGNITITEYNDGYVYEQNNTGGANTLKYFATEKGYVAKEGTNFTYVYQYKDHLGNVRVSYTKDTQGDLKIIEENAYYPFGLKHNLLGSTVLGLGSDAAQKLKYNNKEWQDELTLNWYDYGWRNYDPALGRWLNVDPLAELYTSHSPYNYVLNNPVIFIDPDGRSVSGDPGGGLGSIDPYLTGVVEEDGSQWMIELVIGGTTSSSSPHVYTLYSNYSFSGFSGGGGGAGVAASGGSGSGQNQPPTFYDLLQITSGAGSLYIDTRWFNSLNLYDRGYFRHSNGTAYKQSYHGGRWHSKTDIKAAKAKFNSSMKLIGKVGNLLTFISAGATVLDGLQNGWQGHHTADLLITGGLTALSFTPVGWAAGLIGGTYFVADLAWNAYSGKSITESLFD